MALPVTLREAIAHLKADDPDEDRSLEIEEFLADAAGWVERYTGHLFQPTTVTETFCGFNRLYLAAWPIASGAPPVLSYLDAAGLLVTVAGARLDPSSRPARVVPALNTVWPYVSPGTAVSVTVGAGYASPDDVPRNLCRAMKVMITAYDRDREGGDLFAKAEIAAKSLCRDFRRNTL